MDMFKDILTFIFSATGISVIIIYLSKRFIDKSLDIGVENYKNTLARNLESHKAELDRKTEEFRAELKKLELEHNIRYSKLHEERATVIKKMYSLLIELQGKLKDLTTLFQGPEWVSDIKRETNAKESLDSLKNFFLVNRIYFKTDLCDKIDEIIRDSWSIIVDMNLTKMNAQFSETGHERAKASNEWHKIDERVSKEINSARLFLENEFRKLMGSN